MSDQTLLLITRAVFIFLLGYAVGKMLRDLFGKYKCKLLGHCVRYDANIPGDPYHCTQCLISLDGK